MALPLPTDAIIDYLSITHRNIYRLIITPDQRCMLKKYLRLIENELDENRGAPYGQLQNGTTSSQQCS